MLDGGLRAWRTTGDALRPCTFIFIFFDGRLTCAANLDAPETTYRYRDGIGWETVKWDTVFDSNGHGDTI